MKQLSDVGSHYLGSGWAPLGKTFEVRSPATGQVIAQVADCGPAEADAAAAAATEAFAAWRRTTAFERSALLDRWAALMVEHKDELAAVMSAEMGKPIKESRGEVVYA